MPYPENIQPNPNYKTIDVALPDYFLIRHTNINDLAQLIDPETNSIVLVHICYPDSQMDDLSTSLLGVFEIAHTRIELLENRLEYFRSYCNPDENVDVPVENENFSFNNNRHYFVLPISKIDGKPVSYLKGEELLEATCCVVHTPTRWNFWHFSIRWDTDAGFIHEINNKTWKKRLCSNAKAFIAKFATITEPNYEELPKALYQKVVAA